MFTVFRSSFPPDQILTDPIIFIKNILQACHKKKWLWTAGAVNRQSDRPMDQKTDGTIYGQMDGWNDGRTDGQMEGAS